jgi:hypothetical protein
MLMINMAALMARAKQIYQTEGLLPLVRQALMFVLRWFFQYGTYYLYETDIPEAFKGKTKAECMPRIQNFAFRVVATNEEADGLEAEGHEFRSQIASARQKLDNGAVAFCTFIDKELAHIGWLAMTEEAKKMLDPLPYKIDFTKNEVHTGGVWTNPKYRRLRLETHCSFKRLQFLNERNIVTGRFAIAKSNAAPQGGPARFGDRTYAEARYLKILWWTIWKERTLS